MPGEFELTSKPALLYHLAISCVGIGEDHGCPKARQLVLDLMMTEAFVKNLFLELPNTAAVKRAIENIRKIDLADTSDAEKVNEARYWAKVYLDADATEVVPNVIHLSDLILLSRFAKTPVNVYACDLPNMAQHSFVDRHDAIFRTVVAKTSNTGLGGSIFLWGSDHFTQGGGASSKSFEYNPFNPKRRADDTPLYQWFPTKMKYYLPV